jgi:hypothetical protein
MRFAGIPCLAMVGASLAWAEDAATSKTIDLSKPECWKVGETVTEHGIRTISVSTTVEIGKRSNQQDLDVQHEYTIVLRSIAIAPDGALAKAFAHIASWSTRFDQFEDESLEGALVEVGPSGWSLAKAPRQPSGAARAWLDQRFGARHQSETAVFQTPQPIAVGGSWAAETDAFADVLPNWITPPARKASARITLERLETTLDGDRAHLALAASLLFEGSVERAGTKESFEKGSRISISGRLVGVPGAYHRGGTLRTDGDIQVALSTSGARVNSTGSVTSVTTWEAGGAMPDLPVHDVAAPPQFTIARTTAWNVGDAVSEKGTTKFVLVATPVGKDGKESQGTTTTTTTTWSDVRTCTAAKDGEPTRFTVWVREWTSDDGRGTDTCLQGAHVVVDASEWTLREEDVQVSPAARRWLDLHCGSAEEVARGGGLRQEMLPLTKVAVGDAWQPDVPAVLAAIRPWTGLPLDPLPSTVSAKLVSAERTAGGAQVAIGYLVHTKIGCVGGSSSRNAEVLKGGTMQVEGTAKGIDSAWTRSGSIEDTMKGAVAVPDEDDGIRRLAFTQTRTVTRRPGGAEGQ